MKPRDFSYGGMFVQKTAYAVACLCMLAFIAASAWLVVQRNDVSAHATGLRSLVGFVVLFTLIAFTPFLIRRGLVVRIDSWGVYIPSRIHSEKRNGLPWAQIAEVRVLHTQRRNVVALIPHSNATLSPFMQRFGAFVLPPVNVPADDLKKAIDDYRSAMETYEP